MINRRTQVDIDELMRLAQQGLSPARLSIRLGVSTSWLRRTALENGIKLPTLQLEAPEWPAKVTEMAAAGMIFTIPKGKYKGRPIDGMPDADRHHLMQCPGCGQKFDMRDLGEVFEHDGHIRLEAGETR